MGKSTGFLEIARHDRGYEKVESRLRNWREFLKPLPEEELRAQAVLLRDIVAKGRAEARMAEAPAHPAPVMQLPEGDPYGVNEVKTLSAGQEIAAEAAEPVDIAPEKAQTPAVTLPNWGPEHPLSCKPLREVDTRTLENLRATLFDRAQEKYVQLIEQIDLELDERRQAA